MSGARCVLVVVVLLGAAASCGRRVETGGGPGPAFTVGASDEVRWRAISRGGKSIAVAAKSGEREWVVRDGSVVGEEYEQVSQLAFSPEGDSLAFAAKAHGRWGVLKNGTRVGDEYDGVGGIAWSPDGKSLAFTAWTEGKWFLVKEGVKEGTGHEDVGAPVFSPDGRSVALGVQTGAWFVVKDGVQVGEKFTMADVGKMEGMGEVSQPAISALLLCSISRVRSAPPRLGGMPASTSAVTLRTDSVT